MALEDRIKAADSKDPCTWHEIMNDPTSTTAQDAQRIDHPLYKCKACPATPGYCKNYVGQRYLEQRRNKDI